MSTDVSEVRAASIIRAMSDLIPEDSELHTCCHENLKSHLFTGFFIHIVFLKSPLEKGPDENVIGVSIKALLLLPRSA
jgi:hypothetical protein